MKAACDLVAEELRLREPEDRGLFLRELLAHAAASLTLLEGEEDAAEAVYRLGDAMVGCTGKGSGLSGLELY